jgi:hypothetical protein
MKINGSFRFILVMRSSEKVQRRDRGTLAISRIYVEQLDQSKLTILVAKHRGALELKKQLRTLAGSGEVLQAYAREKFILQRCHDDPFIDLAPAPEPPSGSRPPPQQQAGPLHVPSPVPSESTWEEYLTSDIECQRPATTGFFGWDLSLT